MPKKQLYRAIYKHLAHKSDSVHKPGDYQHIPPADTGTSPGWRWHIPRLALAHPRHPRYLYYTQALVFPNIKNAQTGKTPICAL